MPELGYKPVNSYLPPRPRARRTRTTVARAARSQAASAEGGFLGWVDRVLSR